ncbi:coenzyme F420 biosynthesis protein [Serinicoccus chungangensis]|uniref:Coenzyme F420 biosynthesis protein n=1 Tax=Serinicoccus chungangensis TaxID=767452 RepID=A0A0W8I243_9MICO|nr:zinc-dependent metalloprotease [Serinicoccus chungangensis]KUG51814.1 coenzyme F420 biosynthesis protein [Serinicoccus chungangensis]
MSEQPATTDDAPLDDVRGSALVDWEFAAAAAARLAPPGPRASRREITDLVTDLRSAAARAVDPVATTARLSTPPGTPEALVVDRAGWIRANCASMDAMLAPVLDEVVRRKRAADRDRAQRAGRELPDLGATSQAISAKVTGTEVAGLLSWISTKVLGQYDLAPQGTPGLMFVAPNILAAERELGVDPTDFRLWVAMHEETHRVQFTAVPWLREHLIERARSMGTRIMPEPEDLGQRLREIVGALPDVVRGEADITQVVATPEQREKLAEVTAVMSLLEGHADVVMDEVGPSVIPSVAEIRRRFTQRRKGAGNVDKLLRRLLGMEAKMRQYKDGAIFVRAVQDQVGVEGFNRVWTSPQTLPRPTEIADPQAWVARVHG